MPSQIRLYTVDEANALLPQVTAALRALRTYRRQAFKLNTRMSVLRLIWGTDVAERADTDGEDYRASERAIEFLEASRDRALRRMRRFGVQMRSVRHGLVDFYSLNGREIVLLCWRLGEDGIRYWHLPSEGCRCREPIEFLEAGEEDEE
jgi:hypothetical protein